MNNDDTIGCEVRAHEVETLVVVAASEVVVQWLAAHPAARGHIAAGAGVELAIGLLPTVEIQLRMRDAEGVVRVVVSRTIDAGARH